MVLVAVVAVAMVGWFATPNITELMRVARECASTRYKLFRGSKKKLEKLVEDLEGIKRLLDQASPISVNDQAGLDVLWRLKDDIHDAEELLDQFVLEIKGTKSNNSLSDQLVKVLKNLEETSKRARDLFQQVPRSSILTRAETGPSPVRDKRSFFGYHDEYNQLYSMLQQQQQPDGNKVIAIVGHGGMGKTELARQAFRDTKDKFDLRIWVHAYGKNTEFYLLQEIWSSATGDRQEVNLSVLHKELEKLLASKRCLLVLDDFWNHEGASNEVDRKQACVALDSFKRFAKQGSRIVMTTRAKICSTTLGADDTIVLDGIKPEEMTRLVNDTANLESDGSKVQDLLDKQVPKLRGSPLAAVEIGDELKQQTTSSKRREILEDIENHLGSVLSNHLFTYRHLPPHLQRCFEFCSIFPNNWRFEPDKLTRMWIAHGYVVEGTQQGPRMVDVARGYFDSLVDRSLFHKKVEPGAAGGKETTYYVIHEQIHWMIRHASSKNCISISANGCHSRSIPTTVRHLSVTSACFDELKGCNSRVLNNVRTLLILKNADGSGADTTIDEGVLKQFKGVRVLDLTQTGLTELPGTIGKLKHIRYMGLPSTMRTLCEQLTELWFVQTFNVSNDGGREHTRQLQKFPKNINWLNRMRHLNINTERCIDLSGCSELVNLPESFGTLIRFVKVNLSGCSGLVNLPESFGELFHLVDVNLSACSGLVNLPESFGELIGLVHANLSGCSGLATLPESFGKLIHLVDVNLSGCSGLATLPESFRKLIHLVDVNLSGCSGLVNLPESFGELIGLVDVNLSACSGLVNLPESFGELIGLVHVNLLGCSGLATLPESFGKLIHLVHVNLSGCSGLATLPESFENLVNLLHIDLSHCHRLSEILEVLQKFVKLVYLDLSFWSCFQGIEKCLGRLTNLEHLNLSNPCCYLAQQRSHLQEIKNVIGKLTKLRYLNLSMCLNPIFYNHKSEKESLQYIQSCLSGLSSLEHLDLSHNTSLVYLPESLCDLNRMHTLNLSGCIRLKKVSEMKSLKFIALRNCRGLESCNFVVRIIHDDDAYSSSNIVLLEDVNCQELQISCLENLNSLEEASRIRLVEKQSVEILKLCWSIGAGRGSLKVEENALLGELVPPHSLQSIELHGYGGETCHPAWWIPSISSHLTNLVEVTMENFPSCTILPPLGLIPNLQRLVLRGMPSITRIDIGDLSGGSRKAFSQLSEFTIDDMKNLREFNSGVQALDATCYTGGEEFMGFIFRPWKKFIAHRLRRDAHSPGEEFMDSLEELDTTCYSDEKVELMFPVIDELVMKESPELIFGPLPPRARKLLLSGCHQVMSSWRNRGGVEGSSTPVTTELVVERCNVPSGRRSLLHHLPGLQTLVFSHCDNMTSLPEDLGDLKSLQDLKIVSCQQLNSMPDSMKQLSSLQSIHFSECEGMTALPEWFEHLTSLILLTIDRCPAIESLPQSIGKLAKLKGLNISGCPRLKTWCELDENKSKLVHIRLNFGEIGTSSSGQ